MRTPPPASGAWRPSDGPGRRQFVTFATERPLALDGGASLRDVVVAYETWGRLDADAANAILICHAWTGDSHVRGPMGDGHAAPGWWDDVVGPGLAIDTDHWFVVCANVLGGCQGSTGPSSIDPATSQPLGSRFPVVTIRDMVRVQSALTNYLGIGRWASVIGGSMGGMQALEWAITYPLRVASVAAIATCAQATAQQIAWGAVGRRSIKLDPRWRGGDYYDAAPGDGPHEGLAVARMVAQITFRTDDVFTDRFGRQIAHADQGPANLWQRFEVERYLDHHGDKLVRRFDANSYLVVGKAMDLHDVGRGRGGLEAALARIRVPLLSMGVSSDMLYPTYQQRQLHEIVAANDVASTYVEIESPHGHDGFLIEGDRVGDELRRFLDDVSKNR